MELLTRDFRVELLLATKRERVVFNRQRDLPCFMSGNSALSTTWYGPLL